jgi:hypothetical protein
MRIFQRNVLNVVAKFIASRVRILKALAPTSLPMDYPAEAVDTAPGQDTDARGAALPISELR